MITLFFPITGNVTKRLNESFLHFTKAAFSKIKKKHVAFKMAVHKDTCNILHQINNIN